MRHVCYVTGTRADFGLMRSTLKLIQRNDHLRLSVFVTGMHLESIHGATVTEIEAANLPIMARHAVGANAGDRSTMVRAIGRAIDGMVQAFQQDAPDLVLVLGDRGEMLAGALVAAHLNIAVAHIHGGEISGSVDESIRHAISKLAHFHFVATLASRDRLVRMGESPDRVFVTGAPGLDDIVGQASMNRAELCKRYSLDADRTVGLLVFHPVVQTAEQSGEQARTVLTAAMEVGLQLICLMPNSDAGSAEIRDVLGSYQDAGEIRLHAHLERSEFLSWMRHCDVMIGNSSSGIIESASFGTPVVNIGTRQRRRERNRNSVDVPVNRAAIRGAIEAMLAHGRFPIHNIYGDGQSGARIAKLLGELPIDLSLLGKVNEY